MTDKNNVKQFLDEFKIKLNVWGIYYRDERGKNMQTLLDLDIRPDDRTEIIKTLKPIDYSEGPLEDLLHGKTEMWVFGKIVNGTEVYIKITPGNKDNKVICISFHIAERPMNYPFK